MVIRIFSTAAGGSRFVYKATRWQHCNYELRDGYVSGSTRCKWHLTDGPTHWFHFQKPKVTQMLKKCLKCHGSQMFIRAITRDLQWPLSRAITIQSILSTVIYLKSTLLSLRLRLGIPCGLLPSGFPVTFNMHNTHSSPNPFELHPLTNPS
jgi:hypothetical protein